MLILMFFTPFAQGPAQALKRPAAFEGRVRLAFADVQSLISAVSISDMCAASSSSKSALSHFRNQGNPF